MQITNCIRTPDGVSLFTPFLSAFRYHNEFIFDIGVGTVFFTVRNLTKCCYQIAHSGTAWQSAIENWIVEEFCLVTAFTEHHLTTLRRAMWAVWCWSSWIARRHSSALERDKNSTHLSLLYWLASVAVGWWAALLCSSSAALDVKNGKGKEACALWVQPCSLAFDIFGSASLHTDLQWSAIRLFPVSTQDMAVLWSLAINALGQYASQFPVARPCERDASFSWL